ncbi:MAG: adenylate/guanylate cyclase domain-containing protein [Candidatus Nanopelagicales bacterium]
MTSTCPGCSRVVDPDDAFCRGCGTRLNEQPAPDGELAGERRQLTVMFCDLVGSTEMASQLDPEDVQTVLRRYQETATQIIGDVEGYVAQYLGDGILAYFGYPTAHEDDPLRAVSAGLDIVAAMPGLSTSLRALVPTLPADLAVRIGIHTGGVVVGSVGSSLRRETLASGPAVNQAARLAAAAASQQVVVSGPTAKRIGGVFQLDDLGTLDLKGIAEPVQAYAVPRRRGTQSRIATWAAGSGQPLVGRDDLLLQLDEAWQAAGKGTTTVVLLRGDAGIGKSRLLQALRQRLSSELHGWIACYGYALERSSAFRAVTDAVRGSLGLDEDDPADEQRARVTAALSVVELDDEATLAPIERQLGVGGGGDAALGVEERRRTVAAMAEWWLRLARHQPMVMALEDLHWFDPSSLELVAAILERASDERILVVGTLRPDVDVPLDDPRVQVIDVPALEPEQTQELVRQLLAGSQVGSQNIATVVERSDGVPLYAEELARGLLEQIGQPAVAEAVPASLHDSFTARLDRLGEAKRLAQLGALLGRSFDHTLLAAVADLPEGRLVDGLGTLVQRQILFREGVLPRTTYTFHHALLQDVAADSMLRQRRREEHRRIADILVTRFADVAADRPAYVAHHLAESGDADAAVTWFARAGAQATGTAALAEAVADYGRALALLEQLEPGEERDRRELDLRLDACVPHSMSASYGDPRVRGHYRRARELCRSVEGGSPRQFEALYGLARSAMVVSDLAESVEASEELLAYGQVTGDPAHVLAAQLTLCQVRFWQGYFARSLEHSRRTYELSVEMSAGPSEEALRTVALVHPRVMSQMFAGWSSWSLGDQDAAVAASDDAMAYAATLENPFNLAMAASFAGVNAIMMRDVDRAEMCATRAIEVAERHGMQLVVGQSTVTLGWVQLERTGSPAAVGEVQRGMEILRQVGTGAGAPGFFGVLSECLGRIGQHEASLGTARAGLGMAAEKGQNFWDAELLRLVGRAQVQLEGPGSAAAEESLRSALALARRQGSPAHELRVAHTLARTLADRGEPERATAELAPVVASFPADAVTRELIEARELLAALGG